MTIESSVAMTIAVVAPTGRTSARGSPMAVSGPASSDEIAGSIVYPVSRVVSVMPSCALERCVEVILSAEIVMPSRVSPRSRRASRSARSRLTSANSLATNKPVPIVRRSPMPRSIHSDNATSPISHGRGSMAGRTGRGRIVHCRSSISATRSGPIGRDALVAHRTASGADDALTSPADGQRLALLVPGRRLDADERAVAELVESSAPRRR